MCFCMWVCVVVRRGRGMAFSACAFNLVPVQLCKINLRNLYSDLVKRRQQLMNRERGELLAF